MNKRWKEFARIITGIRPKGATPIQLLQVGILRIKSNKDKFLCLVCNHIWKAKRKVNGKLYRDYWQCPNGCNWDIQAPLDIPYEKLPEGNVKILWGDPDQISEIILHQENSRHQGL